MAKSLRWKSSDKQKITKAFKQSAEGQALVSICAAAFKKAMTDGLSSTISKNQSSWKALSTKYVASKGSETKWVKTGKLLKGVTNNAPTKLRTSKGVLFGMDWKKLTGYIIYTGTKRKGITSAQRRAVHFLLNKNRPLFYWSAINKDSLVDNVQKAIETEFSKGGFIIGGKR